MTPDSLNVLKALRANNRKMTPAEVALYLHVNDYEELVYAFKILENQNLIRRADHKDDPAGIAPDYSYTITSEGIEALHEIQQQNKREFWLTFRSWLSIGIAFVSLVISIIALLR